MKLACSFRLRRMVGVNQHACCPVDCAGGLNANTLAIRYSFVTTRTDQRCRRVGIERYFECKLH